jgi:hypothetical protein
LIVDTGDLERERRPLLGLVQEAIETNTSMICPSRATSFIRRSAGRDRGAVLTVLSRAVAKGLGPSIPGKILSEALQVRHKV